MSAGTQTTRDGLCNVLSAVEVLELMAAGPMSDGAITISPESLLFVAKGIRASAETALEALPCEVPA